MKKPKKKVTLLGSGANLREVLKAADILAEKHNIAADVWSVTSYNELRRDCLAVERWNRLHPTAKAKKSFLEEALAKETGPFIAASDYMKVMPDQISKWLPGKLTTLGTDGFGRSEDRPSLRRHFEVNAAHVVVGTLYALAEQGDVDKKAVSAAIKEFDIDPEALDPQYA